MVFSLCLALVVAGHATDHAAPRTPGYHVIKRIPAGGEGGWDYLTVDGAARRFYISRGTHVMVLDADSGKPVGDIPDTPGVHGIALASDLGRGFISDGGDNTVTVFDPTTLKALKRVTVGTRPDAIMYDPATHRVFTFNAGSSDTTAVDAATESVVGTVPLGGKPEFAVSDERGTVFVNIEDKSEIVAFDAKALMVKKRWSIAPGEEPSGLAIDRKHHRLFVVCSNGKMVISDAEAGKVIGTADIGQGPDAAAFDPGPGFAFSSNGRDGTLTIVKEEKPGKYSVVQTVPTAAGARTMALDPKTHRIYLVTAKMMPPPPGQPGQRFRRSYEPGSFEVLIVGP